MEEPYLAYSMAFKHRRGRKPPELVITVLDTVFAQADHLLRTSRILEVSGVHEYLKGDFANPWYEPELCLTSGAYGIRGCGYLTHGDGVTELHFPYLSATMYRVTMTLHVLFVALAWSMEQESRPSNRRQHYTISTRCEHASVGWGHAMHGDIFPAFRRLLAQLPESSKERIAQEARQSVLEAHVAFVEPDKRRMHRKFWNYDCRARIEPDGRFYIACPGNACDIAIYPDSDSLDEEYCYCTFSCHNLDAAVQQLSLLAGLATLCHAVIEDMEKI